MRELGDSFSSIEFVEGTKIEPADMAQASSHPAPVNRRRGSACAP